MKKFLLLAFIALCAIFIYLKLQILGNPNSTFNQTTRYKLGRYRLARYVLGLHNDGDARAWYLDGGDPLIVEAVHAKGINFSGSALDDFSQKVRQYTGRPVEVDSDDEIPDGTLTAQDLASVVKNFRRHQLLGQPNLFIIYADDFQGSGSAVGETFQEFGIVLSHANLAAVTQNYPDSLSQYEESTMLHEFGHQLGLDHNTGNGCIMNASVEHPTADAQFNGQYTQTDFCDLEKDQINQIKASVR